MTDPKQDFIAGARSSYDVIAADYAALHPDSLEHTHLDLALLAAFAELVRATGPAPVADVGSGPGYVTARLRDLGLPVFGIDVSPRMVALAREAHPGLRFEKGTMTALDVPDGSLGGVVALYSTIHVPDDRLPGVLAEFHRVLVPGGHVMLGFTAGRFPERPDHMHLAERFGHEIALDYYFRHPDQVVALLPGAGLDLYARVLREPEGEEKRPRAFVLARKPLAED
ncbi:class I SAM-dependent methyltransferase [Streptomyces sp. NPDC005423]|uniref:class I SAM-dependent methyltransferase n=1 Tax=Streptomyces sp. NPDC005423 TaxID=3155343 RepID=UPI0033A34BE6